MTNRFEQQPPIDLAGLMAEAGFDLDRTTVDADGRVVERPAEEKETRNPWPVMDEAIEQQIRAHLLEAFPLFPLPPGLPEEAYIKQRYCAEVTRHIISKLSIKWQPLYGSPPRDTNDVRSTNYQLRDGGQKFRGNQQPVLFGKEGISLPVSNATASNHSEAASAADHANNAKARRGRRPARGAAATKRAKRPRQLPPSTL